MNQKETARVQQYLELLDDYLASRVRPAEFVDLYQSRFLAESTPFSEPVFLILDRLFADIDGYCMDKEIRREMSDGIGPEELRTLCLEARAKLAVFLDLKP